VSDIEMSEAIQAESRERGAGWQPLEPVRTPPVFVWPPQPLDALRSIFGFPGYFWPWNALYTAIAFLTWRFLTPDLARMQAFAPGWITELFVCNLVLLLLVVGAWHWRLYIQRAQQDRYKYHARWPGIQDRKFLFGDQVRDNLFRTIVSAVPIWTAYEVLLFWAQANGYAPAVSWRAHPLYCLALLLLMPLYKEVHFYTVHRLIHWPLLYRTVHRIHHKNVNVGPWSGLAMHPLEHLLYFSGVLLYWIVPAHPFHVLLQLQETAFSPSQGHSGFGRVELSRGVTFDNDHYVHYLHHKYFEVNYGGDQFVPLDRWFGTFHDGSKQAHEMMVRRVRARAAS
jgi:sterol desaturase/sphingolipid hydroxylase (fatty acid hydroxylase superfamily)